MVVACRSARLPLEQWTDHVRTVMDAAGSKRGALLGHADGSQMAMLFAATYPERTSRRWYGRYERLAMGPRAITARQAAYLERDLRGVLPGIVANTAHSEVLVSSTVKDLVAGSGLRFVDRGVHSLHGVPGEWRLFAVA